MKRMSVWIGLVGLVAFFGFVKLTTEREVHISKTRGFQPNKEGVDDAVARARLEWMQLRNPYTNEIPKDIRSKELAYAKNLPSVEAFAKSRLQKAQLLSWTFRGPINQGGRTRALAYDVSDATGNTILAGGASGGMWRSTDAGTSWTRSSSLSDSVQSVSCLAQDPRVGNQNIWYYGTGELRGNSASGGGSDASYTGDGIYKSTDGGVSWQKLTSTASWTPQAFDLTTDYVWDIVVDPTNGNVYAATYGEIDRSTDGGITWNPSLAPTTAFSRYTDVAVTSTGIFYAVMSSDGSDGGLYRSTTGALNSWSNITPAGWPVSYDRIVLAVAPSDQKNVYFLGETPNSGFEDTTSSNWTSFWKYTDNGSGTGTWANRSANLPYFPGGQNVGNFIHQHSYDLVIKVKPDNPNFVFIGGTNLYRSSDGFATKTNTVWIGGYSTANDVSSYANQHPDQHSMTFKPGSPGILLSGNDGGISKTTNDSASTVTWTLLNNGYTTSQFYSVAIDMSTAGDQTIIGGLQDNGHLFSNTTSATTPWVKLPFGGDGGVTAIANGKSSYYICTQNGDAERVLLDGTGTLTDFAGVKPSGGSNFLFTTPYVLDPNNTNMMYMAAGSDLWRNSDLTGIPTAMHGGSQNATSVNWTDLTNSAVAGHLITAIGVSTTPVNRLYFGTDSSQVFRLDGANSGNPTPINISGSGFPAAGAAGGAYVSCIAVNPRNADTAIVVFSNYSIVSLFVTTNGGTSWTPISGNLEQNPDGSGNGPSCRWATILPKSSSIQVYVATSTGVYSTSNLNGSSTVWALEGSSTIGNVVSTMVISRPVDGMVVVATHANGVFGAQAVTDVQTAAAPLPRTFSLSQNYPNPFNPSTSIQYVVPRSGSVKLTVFDITGRQIATLAEGAKAAGTYTAEWNGKTTDGMQAASGIYFYRLDAVGFSTTRKMVMLK
jgi:hypothetical protein